MKKIELASLDAFVYYEKLDNGLEVYLLPFTNKNNYYITYATKFGSLQTEFCPVGEKKMCKVPDGIAHFLEHKMFEQEDGVDPFTFYAKSGTGANASTTFDSTQYLCYGNQNLIENLNYLLDYVSEPYFTDENVEKEKGIISQEIMMYEDMPEWVLEDELRRNLFQESPMRIDVAGTVDSIMQITKEDLYQCYNTFYRPDNMFLIVAGKFDPEEIMQVVRDNQSKRDIQKLPEPKVKKYKEPVEVYKASSELAMSVNVPKVGFAFKFDRSKIPIKEDYMVDFYIGMILSLLLGLTSEFREKVRNQQLASSFYYEKDNVDQFRTVLITAESSHPEEFLDALKKVFEHIKVHEKDLERVKKVWISSEIQMIDSIQTSVDNLYYDIVKYGTILPNKVDAIRKLNLKDLQKVIDALDFTNHTTVIVRPKEKQEEKSDVA